MSTKVFLHPNQIIPSKISYSDDRSPRQQNSNWYSSIVNTPVEKLGRILRNNFYLPGYQENHDLGTDYSLAKEVSDKLSGVTSSSSGKMSPLQEHISVRDVEVRLEGDVPLIFIVRLFESKQPVNNKKLQLIL